MAEYSQENSSMHVTDAYLQHKRMKSLLHKLSQYQMRKKNAAKQP